MRNIVVIICVLTVQVSWACDACSIYEFSPLQAKSYFGLFYNYSFLNGYSSLGQTPNFAFDASNLRSRSNAHIGHIQESAKVNPTNRDYEAYQRLDLRFNYNIENKWVFLVNIPIQKNSIYYNEVIQNNIIDDSLQVYSGIGDVMLAIDKMSIIENNTFKHTWRYGLGLFLPTGQLDYVSGSDPAHFTGRGSFEPILRLSYSLKVKQTWGVLSNFSYTFGSTFNDFEVEYQFGQRFNAQVNLFYAYRKGDYAIIPMGGGYYEEVGSDIQNQEDVQGTGGRAVFANIGSAFSYKETLLRVEWQEPISQVLDGNQLKNAGRLNVMVVQNF